MIPNHSEIDKVRSALNEVMEQRDTFTKETYTQIVLALYDKLRFLQTKPSDKPFPAADPDEIRLVTVMFIDIKDSTQIAQRLETEDFKTMLADVHRRIAGIVQEWGGEVGQYLGDGLLCFFGAHRSRIDDASRAVSAGLMIQQSMAVYARQFESRYHIDFAVRIAISTGKVVVGMIGTAEKKEFLAMGTTTNLAARLQGLANPGEILIDSETYHRVQDNYVTESRLPALLKGFEDPITYYVVFGPRRLTESETREYQIAGIDVPFVGRVEELEQIVQIAAQVEAQSRLHLITISGDVGAGKTRLLHHLLHSDLNTTFACVDMSVRNQTRVAPYIILHNLVSAHCGINDDTPPDLVEQFIIQHFQQIWPNDDAEAVAAGIGYLAGYGFDDNPHPAMMIQKRGGQDQIVGEWLATWLHGLYPAQPLLIVIDNMHWADRASLTVLKYMAEALHETQTLIVASVRADAQQDAHRDIIAENHHTQTEIGALNEAAAYRLIRAVLEQVQDTPAALEDLIVERTGANPLFIQEFLRMLFDSGVFQANDAGGWVLNAFHYNTMASTLPTGLLGVLQARLDDLPDPMRQVVQFAAVIGNTFWDEAVSSLAGYDTRPLLDDLELRGIIVRDNESSFEDQIEYSFAHSLYREVVYEMMTRATRETYHRRVVRWLESRVGDRTEYLELLATHYVLGKRGEEAISIYLRAAEERMARGLIDETLRLIEAGLASARDISREHALPIVSQLWLLQAQAYAALQHYGQASAACETATMLMDELPPDALREHRILAARVLGDAYRGMGRYDAALETLQKAETLLTPVDVEHQSGVTRAFSLLYFARGDLNASLRYQQTDFEQAQQSGNPRQMAGSLATTGRIAHERGNFVTALRAFNQILDINREVGNIYYQVMDLHHLGSTYYALSAYQEALALFDEAVVLQESIRYHDPLLQVHRILCQLELDHDNIELSDVEAAVKNPPQHLHSQQMMRLAYINALILMGETERCLEAATALAKEIEGQNLLLFGRVLFSMGRAQHAQIQSQAASTLQQALDYELVYGGGNAWRCYYHLGRAATDTTVVTQSFQQAHDIILVTAASLHQWPPLQAALTQNAAVKEIADALQQAAHPH